MAEITVGQRPLLDVDIKQSDSIVNLLKAMAKARQETGVLAKKGENPHFKSSYVELDEILKKLLPAIDKNDIYVTQSPIGTYGLRTYIVHGKSGEWMQAIIKMKPEKPTPQGVGSAITYMKRYSIVAPFMLNTDSDDDGNEASGKKGAAGGISPKTAMANAKKLIGDDYKVDMEAVAKCANTVEEANTMFADFKTAINKYRIELAKEKAKMTQVKNSKVITKPTTKTK